MSEGSGETQGRRRVGRYEIVRQVGRGGMATVYLARQESLDREVALKELSSFHASSPEMVQRFLRESRLAGSLNHPNIVTVLEYFEDGGIPFIAMEYVRRGSLRPYVGKLSLAQFVGVMEGVLAGLAHAETLGIVHRDLKPENLMVTADGRVKITDFGIAKATMTAGTAAFLTAAGTTVGTPSYMAPEQAMGQDVGGWTDLYSVGIMGWEQVVGHVPFHDSEVPLVILTRHLNERIPAPVEVNPEADPYLSDWIDRLLVKDPRERIRSAVDAWDELEEVVLRKLGPRWRREARLPSPSQVFETPHPLTPAPFESQQAKTPDPIARATEPSEPISPPRRRVSGYVTFGRSLEPEQAGPAPATEPSAPKPFAPEPVAPEPVVSEPVASQPVAPEPVAPEPVAPEPVAPEPVAPEPVAPAEPEPVAGSPAPPAEPPQPVAPPAAVPQSTYLTFGAPVAPVPREEELAEEAAPEEAAPAAEETPEPPPEAPAEQPVAPVPSAAETIAPLAAGAGLAAAGAQARAEEPVAEEREARVAEERGAPVAQEREAPVAEEEPPAPPEPPVAVSGERTLAPAAVPVAPEPEPEDEDELPAAAPVRRSTPVGAGVAAAAVAAAIVAGIIGFVIAPSSGGSPAPSNALTQQASAGPVSVGVPASWRRASAAPLAGLKLSNPVALTEGQPGGGTLVLGTTSGTGPSLLPPALVSALGTAPTPQVVSLGRGGQFYRYLDLSSGSSGPANVYVQPTTNGVVFASCLLQGASAGFPAACERSVGSLHLSSGTVLPLGPSASLATGLSGAIGKRNASVSHGQAQLQSAGKPGEQAKAAEQLASAYQSAAAAIQKLQPGPAEASAVAALEQALAKTGRDYGALGAAASHNNGNAYGAARGSIAADMNAISAAFASLAKLGYAAS